MPEHDDQFTETISELANALQPMVLLAGRIEHAAGATARDAADLTGHLRRAVEALTRLRREAHRKETP